MLVIFCQEQCFGPFIARIKFAQTTLSVDNEYQTEIPSLIFKGEVCQLMDKCNFHNLCSIYEYGAEEGIKGKSQ